MINFEVGKVYRKQLSASAFHWFRVIEPIKEDEEGKPFFVEETYNTMKNEWVGNKSRYYVNQQFIENIKQVKDGGEHV